MGGTYAFFRSPSQGLLEGRTETSTKANSQPAKELSRGTLQGWIVEFVGKSGVDIFPYTLGEVLDMIAARDEEAQINWACSAQSPELLPEKYRKAPAASKKRTTAFIKGVFE